MSAVVEAQRARQRAKRLYKSSRFQDAYMAGFHAARLGRPADSCPYPRDPRKTWRGVYRRAWIRGWQSHPKEGGNP